MNDLLRILNEVRGCTVCAASLPLGPKPLLAAHSESRILLIGQAPGRATHEAGTPWQDRSGDRLREWLGVSRDEFYNERLFAIVPTGLCYPGTGASGDLPPRPECAPLWHPRILPLLTQVRLTIYLGSYAFNAHLGDRYENLSAAAEDFAALLPTQIALPHPSPRNAMWAAKRPWFAAKLLPALRETIASTATSVSRRSSKSAR
ncbi:MAG: uracil-DNA glycosylase family protein [Acidobacteria bacterium]|nr:uracil-DNA glycosylase family protein [Acidobacteriota bacterium]